MAEERESTEKTSMKISVLRAYLQATPQGRVRPLSRNGWTSEILLENDCRSPPVKFDLPVPQASGSSLKTPIKKSGGNPGEILTEEDIRLQEKANIEAALHKTGWKIYGTGGAAELLGLKPTTLLSRTQKMGIKKTL